MRVAYIISPDVVVSGNSNGIRSQALNWANYLKSANITVDLIDSWGNYEWESYDVIHFFGSGLWLNTIVNKVYERNKNLILSPILDPIGSSFVHFIKANWRVPYFGLYGGLFLLKKNLPKFKVVVCRSTYEKVYVKTVFNVNECKIKIIPLSYSNHIQPFTSSRRRDYCFHLSSIYQKRKNVISLIRAAKKYDFELILGGSVGGIGQIDDLLKEIADSKSIRIVGKLTQDEMISHYQSAKVFALPSLSEGVGIVALDAAVSGCEIVITNIGGPKEYYSNYAFKVSPYDVDDIGRSVKLAMKSNNQPSLSKYIVDHYSIEITGEKLINLYRDLHV